MLGKERIIKWTTITLMISLGILWILVIVLLLPAILEGPGRLHSLLRGKCQIDGIRYIDNLCERDTSEDFSDLLYKDNWEICKVVQFNITAIVDQDSVRGSINCTWTYPEFFQTEKDALFTIAGRFKENSDYDCVADSVNKICYPDKKETLIFSIAVSIMGCLFIISIGIFLYAKRWIRLKKEKMNQELADRLRG